MAVHLLSNCSMLKYREAKERIISFTPHNSSVRQGLSWLSLYRNGTWNESKVRSCDPGPDKLRLYSKRSEYFHSVSSTLSSEAQHLNSYVVTYCENLSLPSPQKKSLFFFFKLTASNVSWQKLSWTEWKASNVEIAVISYFWCHSDSIPHRAASGFGELHPRTSSEQYVFLINKPSLQISDVTVHISTGVPRSELALESPRKLCLRCRASPAPIPTPTQSSSKAEETQKQRDPTSRHQISVLLFSLLSQHLWPKLPKKRSVYFGHSVREYDPLW